MKKTFLFLILLLGFIIFNNHCFAQAFNQKWSNATGAAGADLCYAADTDALGNVYTTGYFKNTVDFDPSAGVSNLTSNGGYDVFVCKFNPNGNLVWAKQFGGTADDYGWSIAVDNAANVYVGGYYKGTADFDPSGAVFNLTSNGLDDGFICKLNSAGNFIWANSIGGSTNDHLYCLSINPVTGNIFSTGYFTNTADFDPSAATFNLTSAGSNDIFLCEMTSSGTFVKAEQFGGNADDAGLCVKPDATGNIYLTGYYSTTADFDPSAATFNITGQGSGDIFVMKLSATGALVWAKSMGGAGYDYGWTLALDAQGNIYSTGCFASTPADFDPGVGTYNLNANTSTNDIYISKLDNNGNFVWAKQIGSTGDDWGRAIKLVKFKCGTMLATSGYFQYTADFDPGSGTSNLTSLGGKDIFVSILDLNGNYKWAGRAGGSGDDMGCTIAGDTISRVWLGGAFSTTADLDITSKVRSATSNGNTDLFISQYGLSAICSTTFTTLNVTHCGNSYTTYSKQHTYTSSGTYYDTVHLFVCCDSLYTYNLTLHHKSFSTSNVSICNGQHYTTPSGKIISIGGVYKDTIANHFGCDSIITVNLAAYNASSATINQTICANKTFNFNGNILSHTGIYKDTILNHGGCDSIITLNLTVNKVSTYSYNDTICANHPYLFNNHLLNSSGVYFDTLTNYLGCDSFLTLHLFVKKKSSYSYNQNICAGQTYSFHNQTLNNTGIYFDTITNYLGCDSFITLHLTVYNASGATINQTICANKTYNFNGTILNTAGTYKDTILNHAGCDSVIILNLAVNAISNFNYYDTICANHPVLFNNHLLNSKGVYFDTLTNYLGCDSFITLHLVVKTISNFSYNDTICANHPYLFNNHLLNSSGIYFDTLTNAVGCDSFITLNLVVKAISNFSYTQNICPSQTYFFHNQNLNIAGTYFDTLTNYVGCDSFITMHLALYIPTTSTVNQTICANKTYNLNGKIFSSAGTFYDTIPNYGGCDSIITLNLVVNKISTYSFNDTICDNQTYSFNNHLLNSSGIYFDTLTNYLGCDSFLTLNLFVKKYSSFSYNDTICANKTYFFNNQFLSTAGIFFDTLVNAMGCDSFITLNLSIKQISHKTINQIICDKQTYAFNSKLLDTTGIYFDTLVNAIGCDSFITLNLVVKKIAHYYTSASIAPWTTYIWHNQSYGNGLPGSYLYVDTFKSYLGCDSLIDSLHLVLLNCSQITGVAQLTIPGNICSGNSYLPFITDGTVNLNSSLNTWSGTVIGINAAGVQSVPINFGNTISTPVYVDTSWVSVIINYSFDYYCGTLLIQNQTQQITEPVYKIPVLPVLTAQTVCMGKGVLIGFNNSNNTYSYAWTPNSTLNNSFIAQPLASPTTNTTYTVVVTGAGGCATSTTQSVSILTNSFAVVNINTCPPYAFNNHSLTVAGTYYDTLTNYIGCDSFITLNLTFKAISNYSYNHSICANQTYLFNNHLLNTAGSYFDTLTNAIGCDSIITLNLTIKTVSNYSFNHSICANETYSFNNHLFSTAGIYFDTLTNAIGCDSFITLNLAIKPISNKTINQNICAGQTYSFNNQTLNSTGIYFDTLTNYVGCDSFITLHLTVYNASAATINQTICANKTYNFNGKILNTAGIYKDTILNHAGCDSVITLNLGINNPSTATITQTICANKTYNFNGTILNTAGIYKDTILNYVGCDSVITLNLAVKVISNYSFNHSICAKQTYNFNGKTLKNAGTYKDTLVNAVGCDSIITLTLTVKAISTYSFNHGICAKQTYNFNGKILKTTGTYKDTLVNAVGCDSIITLHLTVYNATTATINKSICAGQTYNFHGKIVSTAGTYKDTIVNHAGCDSIITLRLAVNNPTTATVNQSICANHTYNFHGKILKTAGTYKDTIVNHAGCDSIITLHLTTKAISTYSFNKTICANQTYFFNNHFLNSSGAYFDTLTNAVGCDSFITLNLTVKTISTSSYNHSICANQTYLFNNHLLNSSGVYFDTLTNSIGCDSIVALHLQVLKTTYFNFYDTVCSHQAYHFHNLTIDSSGTYRDTLTNYLGCDSIITARIVFLNRPKIQTEFQNLSIVDLGYDNIQWINCSTDEVVSNINSFTPAASGNYKVIVNKDGCRDTSGCVYFDIDCFTTVSPNPARDVVNIKLNCYDKSFHVLYTDILGRVLLKDEISGQEYLTIYRNKVARGTYILYLFNDHMVEMVTKIIWE